MPISFFLFVACKLSGNVLCLLEIEELWNRTKEKEEEKKKKERMRKLVNDWRESQQNKSPSCMFNISVSVQTCKQRERKRREKRNERKIIATTTMSATYTSKREGQEEAKEQITQSMFKI